MKMDKTIHGNFACISLPFLANRTQLTGKPSAPFERALNGLETTLRNYSLICT
jgi:hypothetical protein